MVFASDPELIEDIRKAPEDILSFRVTLREVRIPPQHTEA
jgi:hypothetical protein